MSSIFDHLVLVSVKKEQDGVLAHPGGGPVLPPYLQHDGVPPARAAYPLLQEPSSAVADRERSKAEEGRYREREASEGGKES